MRSLGRYLSKGSFWLGPGRPLLGTWTLQDDIDRFWVNVGYGRAIWPSRALKSPDTSTPQLPFKRPQIPSNRDHKALNRGTLGGLGKDPNLES